MSCQNCPVWEKSIFSDLDPEALARLNQIKVSETYEKGQTLSVQGAPVGHIYCLRAGATKIIKKNKQPVKESIVRLVTAGDLVGYRCIFSEDKYKATAVALTETHACKIATPHFFALVEEDYNFARKVLSWMGKEIASAENHHHSFCLKSTRERIAEALFILSKKCGVVTEEGTELQIPLTRTDFAEWIGTAKETLIRCLSDFRQEGLISQTDDHVVIIDMDKLKIVAALNV